MEVMHVLPGTVSRGVELLNDGHLLAISPGIFHFSLTFLRIGTVVKISIR